MPTDALSAATNLTTGSPAFGSSFAIPDCGPMHALPRDDSVTRTAVDQNGNTALVWWDRRGFVMQDRPGQFTWWMA
jgi:hypothetical protein